ncbi:MAG: hypothetical protein WAW41_10905 [Methylobacter sp.]
MAIKIGRCINVLCPMRGKPQDVDDAFFVCTACQESLAESVVTEKRNSNTLLLLFGVICVALVLGGVWLLLNPLDGTVQADKTLVQPKLDSQKIIKKPLEEWLKDYSVDR